MTTELRGLTGARGVAAWLVVLYHVRQSLALPDGVIAALAKGYLAVDFFFLLSGFVIWATYAERIREGRWAAVPDFLLRRIARIWPLHLVMLAFAVGIALLLVATGRPLDPRFDFTDLPAHILLVQNWRGPLTADGRALDWNDPAWSISCELFAYLLFPAFAMLVDWRKWPSAGIVAAITALVALMAGVMAWNGLTTIGQDIARFGLLRCVVEFCCGTGIAALWVRYRDTPSVPVAIGVAVALLGVATFLTGAISETASMPVAFAATLFALAVVANARGNPLASRPLHYLGEISFATYLSHSLLWKAYKLAFVADIDAVPWPTMAMFLLVVLVASIGLYHLVERPAQRRINALSIHARRAARVA